MQRKYRAIHFQGHYSKTIPDIGSFPEFPKNRFFQEMLCAVVTHYTRCINKQINAYQPIVSQLTQEKQETEEQEEKLKNKTIPKTSQ